MLFLLLVIFQEAFHQPFCECLTIGIYHQPTLIERILDIAEKIIVIADGQLKKIGTKQEVLPELLGTAKACQTLTEKL